MGVNEIKQEIGKYEHSIKLQQQALDKLRNQIIEETKPFVKIQLKSEVESRVKHNPEHTKELGRDALSAMKHLDRTYVSYDEIMAGGTLEFFMSPEA